MPRFCIVIPTYNNPHTIRAVVMRAREASNLIEQVIVVDDGSDEHARAVARSLADEQLADVVIRGENGGKGAAVLTGLERADALGFTHAVQVDADGQHNLDDVPAFLAASQADPRALVLGQPIFDHTAPRNRRIARKISVFWAAVETLSMRVGDPLCGYRLYPVLAALRAGAVGRMMDFDPEIAVRMVWNGAPTQHVRTRVRYFSAEEGGVSHYQGFRDTVRISLMHTRLCFIGVFLVLSWPFRALGRTFTRASRAERT
jgi:polyprenyl-phospho-N-acetylgalactosaminyl synthase